MKIKKMLFRVLAMLVLVLCSLGAFTQNDAKADAAKAVENVIPEVEWVMVKASEVDSNLLRYLENKGYAKYENPYMKPAEVSNFLQNVGYFSSVTNETLSSINKNANEFADTDLGLLSMWLIGYSVVGGEITDFLLRLLALVIFATLIGFWWYQRMLPKSVLKNRVGDTKIYDMNYPYFWNQVGLLIIIVIVFMIIL